MKRTIFSTLFIGLLFFFVWPKPQALADCARPTTTYGNSTLTQSCTFSYTIDGVDNPQNTETSTANAATITLGNFNLTVSAGQTLVAGSFITNGTGGIALGSGSSLLPGGGIWVVDNDATNGVDGWPNDFTTRFTATASGRRRMGLMKTSTTDCDTTNGSLTNNCYSYSQSTYYGYGQANYYGYGQGNYYGYGQGNYYAYSQSGYSYCFLPDMDILMADGTTKNISEVQAGDIVISYNPTTGQREPEKVVSLITHPATTTTYLTINGEIKVTANHPLFINGAWNAAGTAKVGDMLVGANGQEVQITSLSESAEGVYDLYNLHLEGDNHSYFAQGILAHNK